MDHVTGKCPCCEWTPTWRGDCGRRCYVEPHRILQDWISCPQPQTRTTIRRWAAMWADWPTACTPTPEKHFLN